MKLSETERDYVLVRILANGSKTMPQIGYQWLSNRYGIAPVHPFAVQSEIGRTRSTSTDGDIRREIYPEPYRPTASLTDNLTFAFRHEGIHLEFLARLYARQSVHQELEAWIAREPTGAYARRACFFYEWLMPEPLDAPGVSGETMSMR